MNGPAAEIEVGNCLPLENIPVGRRPTLVLPSPPPCGWSLGFITEPRTVGLMPI